MKTSVVSHWTGLQKGKCVVEIEAAKKEIAKLVEAQRTLDKFKAIAMKAVEWDDDPDIITTYKLSYSKDKVVVSIEQEPRE